MKVVTVLCFTVLFTISPAFAATKQKSIPYSDTIGWKLCQDKKNFDCVIVKESGTKKRTPETWANLFPNAAERELMQKLNRLNIMLKMGMPLAVPKDKKKTIMDFSPFPKSIEAPKEKLVIFDPALLAWSAYDQDGRLLHWAPALGGKDYCPDVHRACRTVVGNFKVITWGDAHSVSNGYPIERYKPRAKIPWVVWFYLNPQRLLYGIHGSNMMEGKHASHGCVRTFTDDAKWLNKNFVEIGTRVIVRPYPQKNPHR
jgi:hypothetical protein